jgi:hypothetical protein
MSSHAAAASKLIKTLLSGITPDDSDVIYRVDGMVFEGHQDFLAHIGGRYAKQLSKLLRSVAMGREPELAVTAQMFSVK